MNDVELPLILLTVGSALLSTLILLLSCSPARSEPRTLYKAKDIDNARENLSRYGWAGEIVDGWKHQVEAAMQNDRAFLDEIIPTFTSTTHYNLTCPACVGKRSRMSEARFGWGGPTDPDKLTCNDCRTDFPHPDYPETGVLELPRMGQTITYYETPEERAHPEDRAKHAFTTARGTPMLNSFSGLARHRRAGWASGLMLPLAKLHALTGEIAYAERAAWVMDRFVAVYPNYLWRTYRNYFVDLPPAEVAANLGEHRGGGRFEPGEIRHAYLDCIDPDTGHAVFDNGFWGGGRLQDHANDYAWILGATVAYDLIHEARYPDGRPLLDEEANGRIIDDLLVPACEDWEHWGAVHNKGMGFFAISAAVGALLEQPERVRHAIDGFNRMLDERYQFDGFYTDTPGYGLYNFGQLRPLPDILLGYSDPPGYQPEDGPRIEDLNLYGGGHYQLVVQAALRFLAPSLRLPVVADTKYDRKLDVDFVDFLAARLGGGYADLLEDLQGARLSEKGSEYSLWYRSPDLQASQEPVELPLRSEWFPGWHVAVLRGGRKANDTALYVLGHEHRWTVHTGHDHPDILALSYYAYGEELASDRGYFSGSRKLAPDRPVSGQYWTNSTASHNLVLVDEKCQSKDGPVGSNLELFGVAPEIEVVQASGFNAYPQCEEYRRTTSLIRTPDGQTYAVDFFRVRGGENHKYCFNCNGSMVDRQPSEPAPQPVELAPPWDECAYTGWVKNPRAVSPESPYTFTWQSNDTHLDLLLLNDGETVDRIMVLDAPGWRIDRPREELEKPPIQQIMVENAADGSEETLATQYAAVIVPYQGAESPVRSARLIENDPESGAMAVEVQFADRTDIIVSTRDQDPRQYGPASVAGEFAFVSVDSKGRALQGYLLSGSGLECDELQVELPEPSTTLPVRSVSGRTYHLSEPVPEALALPGSYLLATGPQRRLGDHDAPYPQTGFVIESATADSIKVRDYLVFECDEVTLLNSRWIALES